MNIRKTFFIIQSLEPKKEQLERSNNPYKYRKCSELNRCLVCDEHLYKEKYSLKRCKYCGMFYVDIDDSTRDEIMDIVIYTITDWMGLVPVAICISFADIGLVQLIKRRSLFRVDADIMILGVYFVIVFLAYAIFEMIPINYRPILIEGRMEASYPSSTTLLVLSVMPALIEQIQRRLSGIRVKRIITIAAIAFSVFMVTGRLISGVHWFTDIVGGELLSVGLFKLYKAAVMLALKEK